MSVLEHFNKTPRSLYTRFTETTKLEWKHNKAIGMFLLWYFNIYIDSVQNILFTLYMSIVYSPIF